MSEDKPTGDPSADAPQEEAREEAPQEQAAMPAESAAPEPQSESAAASSDDTETRQWAMFAHLAALAGFIIPFGNMLGPLIVWQLKKDVPLVAQHGKEALNFQITVAIAAMICAVLSLVLIGLLLLPVVIIGALVLTIIAAVKANNGEDYQYPLTIRLIS
jgi:uncharacterized Tic20 family protein